MNKFYDIHCHAMNLSHANIIAFFRRLSLFDLASLIISEKSAIGLDLIDSVVSRWRSGRTSNLLAVMENDIGSIFLMVEYYLKHKEPKFNNGIIVEGKHEGMSGSHKYDTIILTPLIMDFGYKTLAGGNYFYNMPPSKPVVQQTIDLFNGIKKYCEWEMYQDEEGHHDLRKRESQELFEIYPFMGINPLNYKPGEFKKLLNKYFEHYEGNWQSLHDKMGTFNGDIETMDSNFFAGIKLYPPLGFDPWPTNDIGLDKVRFMYKCCCDKQIPITVHCGHYSYDVAKDSNELTSPKKWKAVLKEYDQLKLNLAHFGQQIKRFTFFPETTTEWEQEIMQLIDEYPNVYTDFSMRGIYGDTYYQHLASLVKEHSRLKHKVLFGSDFMINLVDSDSYNDYLHKFTTTHCLTLDQKQHFCNTNPERFLFNSVPPPKAEDVQEAVLLDTVDTD